MSPGGGMATNLPLSSSHRTGPDGSCDGNAARSATVSGFFAAVVGFGLARAVIGTPVATGCGARCGPASNPFYPQSAVRRQGRAGGPNLGTARIVRLVMDGHRAGVGKGGLL